MFNINRLDFIFIVFFILLFFQIGQAQDHLFRDSLSLDNASITPIQEHDNLKEIYTGNKFNYSEEEIDNNNYWWERIAAWINLKIRNLLGYGVNDKSVNFVLIFVRFIGVLALLFLIYKTAKAYLYGEGNWIFGKTEESLKINAVDFVEDIHILDFKNLIDEAVAKNNYRLAIRYFYLWTLKKMSDKELIEWDINKTNRDYQFELKNLDMQTQFKYISYIYNNCWYGEFELDQSGFIKAKSIFNQLFKII